MSFRLPSLTNQLSLLRSPEYSTSDSMVPNIWFHLLHPPWFLGGVRTGKGFLPAISVPNISQPASIPRGCSKTTTCRARPNQVLSHHEIGTPGTPKIDGYMQYKDPKINEGMTIQYGYYMYMICTYMYICMHNHYTHSILQYMVPFQ